MKFYRCITKTYHNNTLIGTTATKALFTDEPKSESYDVTWDNIEEMYQKFGCCVGFNWFEYRKGKIVDFFACGLFPKRDERPAKQWKHPHLNVRIEVSYQEYSPPISEVLQWHDGEKAIQYLIERGWENVRKGA